MQNQSSATGPASPVPGLSGLTVIARGGYSTVYRARQDSMGREVALKIDSRPLDDERDRRRFLREAEAAGRMSGHPHVVDVYDAGVTGENRPYLVMELCTGGSYAARLKRQGRLPPAEVRDVGVKIADALHAAHLAGILHRDVKPGNILIKSYGVPGLADFGLAALPRPDRDLSVTVEALTPAYAPPEVFRMERPTPAGDVYSLGASLYALLSGHPPRWPETGTPSLATLVRLVDEPIPDIPGVPPALVAVLRQAMAPDPTDRYPSVAAFRDALAGVHLDPAGARSGPGAGQAWAGQPWVDPAAPTWPVPPVAAFPPPVPGWHPASGAAAGSPAGPISRPGSGPPSAPPPAGGWGQTRPFPPGGVPIAGPPAGRPRSGLRRALVAGGAVLAVVLLLVGAGVGAYQLAADDDPPPARTATSPTASPGPSRGTPGLGWPLPSLPFGPTGGSPVEVCQLLATAANLVGTTIRCPDAPECWGEVRDAAAPRRSCTAAHSWETYLIGALDPATGNEPSDVRRDVGVIALCTDAVLRTVLQARGIDDPDDWRATVLGPGRPQSFGDRREFRCVAGRGGHDLERPYFGGD